MKIDDMPFHREEDGSFKMIVSLEHLVRVINELAKLTWDNPVEVQTRVKGPTISSSYLLRYKPVDHSRNERKFLSLMRRLGAFESFTMTASNIQKK